MYTAASTMAIGVAIAATTPKNVLPITSAHASTANIAGTEHASHHTILRGLAVNQRFAGPHVKRHVTGT